MRNPNKVTDSQKPSTFRREAQAQVHRFRGKLKAILSMSVPDDRGLQPDQEVGVKQH